jgi:hypothetical protein
MMVDGAVEPLHATAEIEISLTSPAGHMGDIFPESVRIMTAGDNGG